MTVRFTVAHGFHEDCEDDTDYVEVEDGATATLTVLYGDVFDIEITGIGGNKTVYYELDIPDISSNTYSKALFRYKTNYATTIKAKIELVFTSGTQTILDETRQTDWGTGTADITGDKTISKIRFYATNMTGHVYYDFLVLFNQWFTFPFVRGTEQLELNNNILYRQVPGRVGNITQYLGADSPTYSLTGIMDTGSGWKGSAAVYGERMIQMWELMHSHDWVWLETDLALNAKVTVPKLVIRKVPDSMSKRQFDMTFRKFDRSSGDETIWEHLDWLGL